MHTLAEIVDIRRHGASFSEVVDAILRSKHLLHEFTFRDLLDRSGVTPESGYLDMSSPLWLSLSYDEQYLYAKDYQAWYVAIQGVYPVYNFGLSLGGNISIPLVLIPPGTFLRRYIPTDVGIAHHIEKPFWCGKYVITNKQFFEVLSSCAINTKPNFPVVNVSHARCDRFCFEAGHRFGTNITITLLADRWQWEYACHAGVHAYWPSIAGQELLKYGWFKENSNNRIHPVGKKLPNAWGLYDMLGNVCEWLGNDTVSGASYLASVNRLFIDPPTPFAPSESDLGFRICKEVNPHLFKYGI